MANLSEKIKEIKVIYDHLKEKDLLRDNDEINHVLDSYSMLPQSEKDKWKKTFNCLIDPEISDIVNNISVTESKFQYYLEDIGISIQDRIDFLEIFDKNPYLSELSNDYEFDTIWNESELRDDPYLKNQINEVKLQTLFDQEDENNEEIKKLKEKYNSVQVNPDELKITILYILFNEII
tara:strand:- start:1763 stop:2299 length:537 start_codon:yes stop_codon:yes gene_type:complete